VAKTYKYDVAFSFLADDSALALELSDEIAETHESFVFPRKQEELVGRDGVEQLKLTYGVEARVVVVLFRDKWGTTPWTGVEKEAIADRALREQQDFLLVVALDRDVALPDWISQRYVYWHFPTYGKAQLAGAIRVKIAEMDGASRPESPAARMTRVARIHAFEKARQTFRGDDGAGKARSYVAELGDVIASIVEDINKIDTNYRLAIERRRSYVRLMAKHFSILVYWKQNFANSLDESGLTIVCFRGPGLWPDSPMPWHGESNEKWTKEFQLDLLGAGQPGWRRISESLDMTCHALAEYVVNMLLLEDSKL
jgi:hypothetical protein